VFAMDGAGHISAHHQTELQKIYWKSALLAQDEDEDEGTLLGGGLAWANGAIFAANDQGVVAALSGSDGKKRWLKELGLPLRSPPRVAGRYVLILTADNQLLCLMQSSGEMVWSHRGMSEMAGKLHDAPPVVRDGMVMVSYSSGETVALDLATGNPLWTENLAGSSQQVDANQFSATSPLMATGLSFAASSQSLTALESETGRRLWERRVPVQTAPWLAGNYLFLQTPEAELLAIRGIDGMIPWITSLKAGADAQEINWYGPVVAAGRIWLSHDNGKLIAFNAKTGEEQLEVEIPSGVMTSPVIAEKAMYLIDSDANLHLLK
jgi:outer membrane protein assembly factor BamB